MLISLGTNCEVLTLNRPITDNSLKKITRPDLYPKIVTGNWDIQAVESKLENLVVDSNFIESFFWPGTLVFS